MPEWLSVQEAQQKMLERFQPVETILVPLESASGRVLACRIIADVDLPLFTNSSMDGFAVRATDTQGASPDSPVRLTVVMDIPAGCVPATPLQPGQTARIMTGAVVPEGADAVVPVEDITRPALLVSGMVESEIWIRNPVTAGENLRQKGQDLHQGESIFQAGWLLRPQDIGLLAALGRAVVSIYRQPRVAILSGGDELIPLTHPLTPGKIRESNSYTLAALAERAGADVLRLGIVPDDPILIRERLESAAGRSTDLILTSAGVSVGMFDYIRQVIEENGDLSFWRVKIRPGKPIAFGAFRGIPLVGLPGNPASAYIGFEVFVRPILNRLSGRPDIPHPALPAMLSEAVETDGRETYLRTVLSVKCGKITATLVGHQGAGNMVSLVNANALVRIPPGIRSLPSGAEVEAWLLDESAHWV